MKNRLKINLLLLLPVLFACAISCNKAKNGNQEVSTDSLEITLVTLQDSLGSAWNAMIEDDDEKLQYMKRLLQEVSYSGSYDEIRLKELLSLVDRLKDMRYDRQSMKNSRLIDKYDSATNEVSRQVISFAYESPVYEESDLMKRLTKDIADKNGMVLIYRVHYDDFAEKNNQILQEHGDQLDTAGRGWQIWPLFRLSPEEI